MNLRKRLLLMIKQQNNTKVKSTLINFKFNHSVKNKGATLLHCAATYGNAEITQYLLKKSFHVDAQDVKGRTPLMKAVMGSHANVVQKLLAAGADIDILNKENKSVLHEFFVQQLCVSDNINSINEALLRALHSKGCSNEEKAKRLVDAGCQLYQAVFLRDAEIIKFMIEQGSPVNLQHPFFEYTALHVAFKAADVKIVKVLIEHGADIEALDNREKTPLFCLYEDTDACEKGINNPEKLEILQFLSDQGILSRVFSTPGGFTQLRLALADGDREAIRVILPSILDFAMKDTHKGATALHYLAMNINPGVTELLKLFVENFDLNARDFWATTAAGMAAYVGNANVLEFLLNCGANIDGNPTHPVSIPLYTACLGLCPNRENLYNRCVELLFEHNADPQVLGTSHTGKRITIIDAAMEGKSICRVEMAIARLAMLEKKGTPIIELVRSKITAQQSFEEYYGHCRRILDEKIKSITIFKLLTESDGKITSYLSNAKLVRKLMRVRYKNDLKLSCAYIFKSLEKRCTKVFYTMRLRNRAALFICKIFNEHVGQSDLVVKKIINYLDDETLHSICKV